MAWIPNTINIHWVGSILLKFASLNHKAFGNLFCNSQKSFHTSPAPYESNNKGYRSFFKLNNDIYTKITTRIFCKCKWHCWVWKMIDSLYYSSRKILERCENSFVNYRINYQKHCYSLQRIWTQSFYAWRPTIYWGQYSTFMEGCFCHSIISMGASMYTCTVKVTMLLLFSYHPIDHLSTLLQN